MATPTVFGSFGNTSGAGTGSSITATMPASILAGDKAVFIVAQNSPAGVDLTGTPNTGGGRNFTLTGTTTAGSSIETWTYERDLTTADSGTTLTVNFDGSCRPAIAGIVIRGGKLTWDATPASTTDTTEDTSVVIPGITPVAADCLRIALCGLHWPTVTAVGITAPGGWTEQRDEGSSQATGPLMGAWVGTIGLTGQAGIAQGTATATAASAVRDISRSLTAAPLTVPGAPTIGTATPGNTLATVTWTAPADNGGTAITGYTVTSTPGSITAAAGAGATTVDVTGLTNGVSYTFTVHATNSIGNSAESAASNAAVPVAPGSTGTFGDTVTRSLNRLAGTLVGGLSTRTATDAANVWAGTTGRTLTGALNIKAGNSLPNYVPVRAALNQLAGTTGLGAADAAWQIVG